METSTPRSLYGGAMSISIPARFEDTSQWREVPNHQEVFADADTDQSVIIEINQAIESTDAEAVIHHVTELAEVSDATECQILHQGPINPSELTGVTFDHGSFAIAEMKVSKYRESNDKSNIIQVYFALLRLKNHTTDLCIIFNVPIQFAEESASAGRPIIRSEQNAAVIQSALASLKINDYSLFGS